MTIGSMFGDVFKSLFKKPVTEKYPFAESVTPEHFRGKLEWDPEKCTGCQLCVKDCPSNAIEIITIDKVNKKFVMRYHMERGFKYALQEGYDAVITVDGDGQHNPDEIPNFVTEFQAQRSDLIIGERDFRKMPFVRMSSHNFLRHSKRSNPAYGPPFSLM